MDSTDAAMIGAAAGTINNAANIYAQANLNKKMRKWNEAQYEKQKQDNLAFWHMQNDYNSPQAQMERLRSAGLNPNLVYGASAPGNSSGQVNSPSSPHWSPEVPKVDLSMVAGNAINMYYDLKMRQAQYDNVRADNTIKTEQAQFIKAQTLSMLSNTKLSDLKFTIGSKYNADMAREELTNLVNRNKLLDRDDETKMLQNMFLHGSFDDRLNSIRLDNQSKSNTTALQAMDLSLRQAGLNPSDPTYIRLMAMFFKDQLKELMK